MKPSVAEKGGWFLWITFGIFVAWYAFTTALHAGHDQLWMDEVLSIWTLRLPSAAKIYAALKEGSEYSPPGYVTALHYYSRIAGDSYLALRLPSVAAVLVTAFAWFIVG